MATNTKETQRKADAKRAGKRARCWTCLVYPDSAPDDWREKLRACRMAYDISPLHDRDLKEDGTLKKPHYHVMIDAGKSNKKSAEQMVEVFSAFGGVYPDPEKNMQLYLKECLVRDRVILLRYLCHLDEFNEHKPVYDISDVESGYQELPYSNRCLRELEKDEITIEMIDYCIEKDICGFDKFVLDAKEDHPEWMHAIINERPGTFLNRFLSARMASNREQREKKKFMLTALDYEKKHGEPLNREFYAGTGFEVIV